MAEEDPFADLGTQQQDPFADAIPQAKVRVMAYGPVVGEHHHDAMYGPQGNKLEPYDVAVSPNLGLQLGEWIEVNGKSRRVADWSFLKPGVPTKNTVEIRDAGDQGHGTINRINLSAEDIQKRIDEYPRIAGSATAGSERAAAQPAEIKGDPFADLIPKGKGAPTGADPFADMGTPTPSARGFKGSPPPTQIEPSPTPTAEPAPDSIPPPQPTPATRQRPAVTIPDVPSPTPSPIAQVQVAPVAPINTAGAPPAALIPTSPEAPAQAPDIPQRIVRALGTYAGQMLPQSLGQVAGMTGVPTDPTDIQQDVGFLFPPARATQQLAQQAMHRMQQIGEAEQTPPYSQSRFDAGIGTVLDLMGMAGLAGGVKAASGMKGKFVNIKPNDVITGTSRDVAATEREVPVPEALQPKAPEKVVSVAIRNKDTGQVTTGVNHTDAYQKISPNALDPDEWSGISKALTDTHEHGFVTDRGRFVPRDEAHAIAKGTKGELAAEDVRPAPNIPEPQQFSVDMPTDSFATEQTPVSAALHEMKVVSKSGARQTKRLKGNEALWNDAPSLAHPTHNKIYSPNGEMPDVAAQTLFDAGLIHEPSVQAMWEAVGRESKGARNAMKSQRAQATTVNQAAKTTAAQTQAFIKAEQQAWKGGEPAVPVKDLQVGDTVTVRGEKFKVTDIDPDTYDVTLEDGRQFGVQTVSDQTVIYGEHQSTTSSPRLTQKIPGEVLVAPANRYPDGSVFSGSNHGAIAEKHGAVSDLNDAGFVTSSNRFVTPKEAHEQFGVLGSEDLGEPEPPTSTPPPAPPTQPQLPSMPEPPPQGSEGLNPVRGSGKFIRSYRIDKELGDRMEGIGAARESGALRAETEGRNLLDGLTPAQETDLGRYLVSRRLQTVNPDHPQIISDIESRRIESDPAISKALDYYKAKIKPEIESFRKRAGLSEKAAAGKAPEFISLIPKTMELLPQVTETGRFVNPAKLPRTTVFAKAASGEAREYNVNMRDILNESYGESIRKARVREFYDAAVRKGLVNKASVEMPDGSFVKVAQFDDLPPELKHDLTEATKANLAPVGLQRVGQIYQRAVTGAALTANPAELVNHMRRQLNLVAAKPPIGQGLLARLEALVPYFGPKLGAFKRTIMDDMSSSDNQAILKDIFDAGGGSTRSFAEQYSAHPKRPLTQALYKYSGMEWLQRKTANLLFGIPEGKGVQGWDLRMRVQLEKIRRSAEGNVDPQRIREFANQIGQYGRHNSWAVEALKKINPYAATTLPMRLTELKTAIGMTGLKEGYGARTALHHFETFARGTGGTILALSTANYLLSGKWPWENDAGHEFDLNTGVSNKDGKTVYVKLRAIAPELSRPVSTASLPDVARETMAQHPQYGSAALTGPLNQAASLLSGPGQNFALTALSGKVPYFLKRPGEGPELMDVAMLKKGEHGQSRGLRQLRAAAANVNPFGDIFGPNFDVEVPDGMSYIEEPVRGIKPFGRIFSTSYERAHGGVFAPPPPPPAPPPIR